MVVLRVVDLRDRDLGILIVALPALRRLFHFARLALRGRVHYTVYVRHNFGYVYALRLAIYEKAALSHLSIKRPQVSSSRASKRDKDRGRERELVSLSSLRSD